VDQGLAQVERWWSRKYNLPPNHPLLLGRSMAELTREMFEDMLLKRQELRELLGKSGTDAQHVLEQINAINEVLGERPDNHDPLAEKWERELEQGLVPDFDETE
jgi:hypothetical protein